MKNAADLIEKARRCRRLADGMTDSQTIQNLRQMADELERKAAEMTNDAPRPRLG